jgi:hypothetical protein
VRIRERHGEQAEGGEGEGESAASQEP